MHRIRTQREAENILDGLDFLPGALWHHIVGRSPFDFFCGDDVFAGLNDEEWCEDGRSYRTTSHVLYPHHLTHRPKDQQRVTIVLAGEWNWHSVVHEVGHYVHWLIDFDDWELPAVSEYAGRNWCENFAEAFTTYCLSHQPRYAEPFMGLNKLGRDDLRAFDALMSNIRSW